MAETKQGSFPLRRAERSLRTVGGSAAVLLGFGLALGWPAALVGMVVALAAFVLVAPFWFVLGHLVFAVLVPSPSLVQLGLFEVCQLTGLALFSANEWRQTGPILFAAFLTVGFTMAVYRVSDALWLAAVTLSIAVGLCAYGLHRYSLVRLGIVGGSS